MPPIEKESLFDRVGGSDALRPLLQHFFADVRQHEVIGPIFARQIDDWPKHIEKILGFWITVTGGPPSYAGPMMIAHLKLQLKPEHFFTWLDLWRRHCHIRWPKRRPGTSSISPKPWRTDCKGALRSTSKARPWNRPCGSASAASNPHPYHALLRF